MTYVEEDALTAELEGVLEEERKENTKQGGCPHAALLLSTANFERVKSRVLLEMYFKKEKNHTQTRCFMAQWLTVIFVFLTA